MQDIRYDLSFGEVTNGCKVSKVGFISRAVNYEIVEEIKAKYNPKIYITVEKSAAIDNVSFTDVSITIITTEGVQLASNRNSIKLPLATWDTYNYIVASEYGVAKARWGTVSESLIAGCKLILVERPIVYEDTFIINKLK